MTITDTRYSYIASNLKLVVISNYLNEKAFEKNYGDIVQVYLEDTFAESIIELTEKSIFWDSLKDEIVKVAHFGCEGDVHYA